MLTSVLHLGFPEEYFWTNSVAPPLPSLHCWDGCGYTSQSSGHMCIIRVYELLIATRHRAKVFSQLIGQSCTSCSKSLNSGPRVEEGKAIVDHNYDSCPKRIDPSKPWFFFVHRDWIRVHQFTLHRSSFLRYVDELNHVASGHEVPFVSSADPQGPGAFTFTLVRCELYKHSVYFHAYALWKDNSYPLPEESGKEKFGISLRRTATTIVRLGYGLHGLILFLDPQCLCLMQRMAYLLLKTSWTAESERCGDVTWHSEGVYFSRSLVEFGYLSGNTTVWHRCLLRCWCRANASIWSNGKTSVQSKQSSYIWIISFSIMMWQLCLVFLPS